MHGSHRRPPPLLPRVVASDPDHSRKVEMGGRCRRDHSRRWGGRSLGSGVDLARRGSASAPVGHGMQYTANPLFPTPRGFCGERPAGLRTPSTTRSPYSAPFGLSRATVWTWRSGRGHQRNQNHAAVQVEMLRPGLLAALVSGKWLACPHIRARVKNLAGSPAGRGSRTEVPISRTRRLSLGAAARLNATAQLNAPANMPGW